MMHELISKWVQKIPNISGYEGWVVTGVSSLVVIVLAVLAFLIAKRIIVALIHKLFTKTSSDLDDILIRHKVFNRIAYLVPAWVLHTLMPEALMDFPWLQKIVATGIAIYFVIIAVLIVDALINALLDIYRSFSISRQIPIKSFTQVAKLIAYFVGMITIVSLVIGESPLKLFAGLGAMTAVLMLIFKDPILGFVAGIQLSYNNMVGIGDWVDIPQHNASGDIQEIGLTTVKVQNFDNTITTVPTQSLINESFKNWRGMQESGGRRIMRSIFIDVNSISFCDEERLARYAKIDYIQEYIDVKRAELDEYNKTHANAQLSIANGRRITNVGTFRAYVLAYLKNHPDISQNMTLLVRQLASSEAGVPLEIYAFSTEKNWAKYETIQADIFDHLFAVAREFDLRIFQKPSGHDFGKISSRVSLES